MAKDVEKNLEITPELIEIVDIPEVEETPESIPEVAEEKPKKKTTRKNSKKKKKAETTALGVAEVSSLLQSVFALVSVKAGEHWQVSEDEAEGVAKPLCNILKKMDLLEKVSNVSDGVALVVGVTAITLPRVMISQELKKQRKVEKRNETRQIANGTGVANNTEVIQSRSVEEGSYQYNGESVESQSNSGDYIKGISAATFDQPI